MKSITRLKEFACIIKGGVTGTLLLVVSGLVLALLISGSGPALPYFGIGHIIESWKKTWTNEGIYTVFVAVGVIGFLLGAIAGWRRSQIIQKWFAPSVVFTIPVMLCLWLLNYYASYIETPHSIKLIDCTNSTVKVQFKAPKGRFYRLALAISPGSTNTFSGRVYILRGTSIVTNFIISSVEDETQCGLLHAQTNYDMEITFDRLPPPSTSVWLRWLQTSKDGDR
jgi:hypothetical protein